LLLANLIQLLQETEKQMFDNIYSIRVTNIVIYKENYFMYKKWFCWSI